MIELIMQGAPSAQPWLGLDWKVIGILVALMTAVIGGMLGLVYKLIVSTFSAHIELSDQKNKALADTFKAAVDFSSKIDNARMDRMVTSIDRLENKREDLERDFRALLERLPEQYVKRDDWIREFNKVDDKLDKIWKVLTNTRETVAKGNAK